jgi:uncharacterized membrane protein YoaK (UPF0700 family)
MMSRLPKWVELGSFLLALIAGSLNAIGVLGFAHQSVSHLTGTTTLLGIQLAGGGGIPIVHLLWIVFSFVLGATLSGFIVRDAELKLGRRYGACLILESMLLFVALFALTQGSDSGHLFASAACGLQNAMVTTYSGAIIRTTHVTGLFTDLGLMLGRALRGIKADRRRARLYIVIILGFVAGGSAGAVAYRQFTYYALVFPAFLALFLAMAYWSFWFAQQRRLQAAAGEVDRQP